MRIYSQDIGMEFVIKKEGINLPNEEKLEHTGKRNIQIIVNIESWYHQISRDERKNQKRVPQENVKATQTKLLAQEPYKRNRYLGCPPSKILGTIFEVDQRRMQILRGGRLITAIRNNIDYTRTNRTEITRKQKWERKQLYGRFNRPTSDISHEKTWTWLRKGYTLKKKQNLFL